jgi:uncharacterized protein YwqG
MLQENKTILLGERKWISRISGNLLNIEALSEYADWLSTDAPMRSAFLQQFIVALKTHSAENLPIIDDDNTDWVSGNSIKESPLQVLSLPDKTQSAKKTPHVDDINTEWLEITGFDFAEKMLTTGCFSHKDDFVKLARPALHMEKKAINDEEIPIAMSKIGGQPDMPEGMDWPTGEDCTIFFGEDFDLEGEGLAGFLGQLNFSDIADSSVPTAFPKSGLLSFFCFQGIEYGDPEYMALCVYYFPETSLLKRRSPPEELTEGNLEIPSNVLNFVETIDMPENYDGPWTEDYEALTIDYRKDCEDFSDYFRYRNFKNVFGYGRSTTGGDPTPSKDYQNLIILETQGETRLHIQITKQDLENSLFDKIELVWADYD